MSLQQFPGPIQRAMRAGGVDATCVPVQVEEGVWEAALFLCVAGPESKEDRRLLRRADTVSVRLSGELMRADQAAIVLLTAEAMTVHTDPLVFEMLLTPGAVTGHHECLRLLAEQPRLWWFFGDSDYRVIHQEEQSVDPATNEHFAELAKESFAHDAMLRMAGRYDAETAVAEVVGHYAPREGVARDADKLDSTH